MQKLKIIKKQKEVKTSFQKKTEKPIVNVENPKILNEIKERKGFR